MHEKMLVTMLNGSGGNPLDYSINYDFFHPAIAKTGWPERYKQRNMLDENTTEEVESGARLTDPLIRGETVRVMKFYAEEIDGFTRLDFYLIALDGKRVARMQTIYNDGGPPGLMQAIDFGFHFRFIFPPYTPDTTEDWKFNDLTRIVGQYMMPVQEYLAQNKAAAATAEARKNVTIQPGMTQEEVVKILGEPVKSITFGDKTYLKYADLTVELQGGKVVDVKAE
jgi:hypothetical protein